MTRRKVAFALASVLLLAALGLGGAAVFFELSPTDYRLLRLIETTERIEMSARENGWHVLESSDAELVATGIEMAKHLEKTRLPLAPCLFDAQVRFVLRSGEAVVFLWPDLHKYEFTVVLLPGEHSPRCYRGWRWPLGGSSNPVFLGDVSRDGQDPARVSWDMQLGVFVLGGLPSHKLEFIDRQGRHRTPFEGYLPALSSDAAINRWSFPDGMARGDLAAVAITSSSGVETVLPVPRVRFDEPVFPCPSCGSTREVRRTIPTMTKKAPIVRPPFWRCEACGKDY